jgi:hypothetical protein
LKILCPGTRGDEGGEGGRGGGGAGAHAGNLSQLTGAQSTQGELARASNSKALPPPPPTHPPTLHDQCIAGRLKAEARACTDPQLLGTKGLARGALHVVHLRQHSPVLDAQHRNGRPRQGRLAPTNPVGSTQPDIHPALEHDTPWCKAGRQNGRGRGGVWDQELEAWSRSQRPTM